MYKISKTFDFSASHTLTLGEGHPCSRLHGHNYTVTLVLRGELDEHGMVVDYRKLASFKGYLDDYLDHRHLNEVLDFEPTAELLARHLYEIASRLFSETYQVMVSETSKTTAIYGGDDAI